MKRTFPYAGLLSLAILCAATLLALLFAEVICRFIRPLSTVEYRMDADVGPLLAPSQRSRWVNEDYDVVVVTNSAGFHDIERAVEKGSDDYRIVVLGDSYIEALQLPIAEGFTQQLERLLARQVKGRNVEVINLGVSGSGPAQYYRILEKKGLAYKPDLVVMAVFPDNDFWDSDPDLSGAVFKPYYVMRPDDSLEYRPPQAESVGSALRPWLRRSAFLHMVRQGIVALPLERWLASFGLLAPAGGVQENSKHTPIPLGWSVYLRDPPATWLNAERLTLRMIREAQSISKNNSAAFLVVMIGSLPAVEERWDEVLAGYPGAKSMTWDFGRPITLLQEFGKQWGFEVVNLTDSFQSDFRATGRSSAWPHDGHWNARGHRLAAEVVSAHLLHHQQTYGLN
ncbi:MAG: hypothetical protein GDA67_11790 [Nitrospira sp. CR1.3]|nr:hypothetical protein [Nitrospira sp. CR1.3]